MAKLYLGTSKVRAALYKNIANNQDKSITENGVYTADTGYTGLGKVTVEVPNETEELSITKNGTYSAPKGKLGYSKVTVDIPKKFTFQEKTIDNNEVVTADEGYDGLSKVTVNVEAYNKVKNGLNIDYFVGDTVDGTLYSANKCTNIVLTDALDLGNKAFYYAFYNCTPVTSVDFSSLTTISGEYALSYVFYGCTNLTSMDLSGLTTVSGSSGLSNAFYNTSLSSVDLSSLTTVSGGSALSYAFYNCTSLTSVDLSNLTTVSGDRALLYAFYNCRSLTSLSFPALTSNSFGSYTNQFGNMLYGVTGCTVHFPAGIKSTIGNWASVTAGFGGTNTVVIFDIKGATINFNITPITSSDTLLYYIGGEPVEASTIISLDDTTYVTCDSQYNTVVCGHLTNLQENEIRNLNYDFNSLATSAITIDTNGIDGCSVSLSYGGVTFDPYKTESGLYYFNLYCDSSVDLSYTVKKKGYKKVAGTIAFNNSPVTETVTMEESSTDIEVTLTPGTTSYGWQTTTVTNPTSWDMYESTNKGVAGSYAVMKVTFSGYDTLTCYINSYAESGCDYTIVSTLDASTYPTSSSATTAYSNTSSKQYDPTTFNTTNWTTVTYSGIDGEEHFFYVVFRKDGSVDSNNDRGYFIIDTSQ